jgi:hypothetical protein
MSPDQAAWGKVKHGSLLSGNYAPPGSTLSGNQHLRHYLYDAGNDFAYSAAADGGTTRIIQPRNGGTATVAGLEVQARLPLGAVHPALRGLTIGADATMLHSAVRLGIDGLDRIEQTQDAPSANMTLRASYAYGPLTVDAAMRFTGAYIQEYGLLAVSQATGLPIIGSAFDTWVRPSRQLDLGVTRKIGSNTIRFQIRNMLDDIGYRATLGRHSDTVPETIIGGRQFAVRVERAF